MSSTTAQSDPEGTTHVRARPGGRRRAPGGGRLRRHAGQDRLRRHRPLHLGQRHGAARRTSRPSASRSSCAASSRREFFSDTAGTTRRELRHLVDLLERRLPGCPGLHLHELRLRQHRHPQHLALLRRRTSTRPSFATEPMPFGPERDAALLDVQQRLIDEVAGVPGHGGDAAGRLRPARRRHAHAGDVRAVRLEARLGQGRRLRARRASPGPSARRQRWTRDTLRCWRSRACASRARAGEILRGVDLAVGRGEVIGLVGESGCGKTTLGPRRPGPARPLALRSSAGTVQPRRRRSSAAPGVDAHRCRSAATASRSCRRTRSARSTRCGAWAPRCGGRWSSIAASTRPTADERVADLLGRLGVADPAGLMGRYPHQLSGGMLQRAAIATALACGPELVIADEPTTALDAIVQLQVIESFLALVRDLGTSLLVISHDLRLLERMADRVAAMYAGRIVEFGPAERPADAGRGTPTRRRCSPPRSCVEPPRVSASRSSTASRRRCRASSRRAPSRPAARAPTHVCWTRGAALRLAGRSRARRVTTRARPRSKDDSRAVA